MTANLRRYRVEALLAIVAAIALYFGAQTLLTWRDAQASYESAVETQQDIEAEAASYDLSALEAARDAAASASTGKAFPTRDEVERFIGEITLLLDDPLVELGPVVLGEIVGEVSDQGLGIDGVATRSYEGVEMVLTLNGEVADLLSVAERLLAAVPDATLQDVGLTLPEAPAVPSLELRVLLFYQ